MIITVSGKTYEDDSVPEETGIQHKNFDTKIVGSNPWGWKLTTSFGKIELIDTTGESRLWGYKPPVPLRFPSWKLYEENEMLVLEIEHLKLMLEGEKFMRENAEGFLVEAKEKIASRNRIIKSLRAALQKNNARTQV